MVVSNRRSRRNQQLVPSYVPHTYQFDGSGRRLGKSVDGTPTRSLLYVDRFRPVAELDGTGKIVFQFVYATQATSPDYRIRSGKNYRIISDSRGSVRLVVDATTGTIAQRLDYDAFGHVTLDTNHGFRPFGFAGGLYDADTKLVRFGARDYDPEIGRWTNRDPTLINGGQANLYAYVGIDPVNRIDPSGLEWGDACQTVTGSFLVLTGTAELGAVAIVIGAGTLATPIGWCLVAVGVSLWAWDAPTDRTGGQRGGQGDMDPKTTLR